MNKKPIIFSLFLLFCLNVPAQEYLTGLMSNPALSPKNNKNVYTLKQGTEVQLPFLDDFSYPNSVYPADTFWEDKKVFVNTSYAVNPPTVGVATFDAIDDTGAVYSWATTTPFIADSLTSLPIRLDSILTGTPSAITVADSIYFSFYYQPQGISSDSPENSDSLLLDFYSPHLNKWRRVWSAPGMKLDTFLAKYNTYFRQVMIPITDTTYIQKGFQFRFKNYASIASMSLPSFQSNADQWNIDYVYLNIDRNKFDTVSMDVAFVDPAPTILKNYTLMPARQFANTDLKSSLQLKMSNLNSVLDNIAYQYVVKQENGSFLYTKSGGVYDILPFITNGYHNYPLHTNPAVDFTLPSMAGYDSVSFSITHMISSNGWTDKMLTNDSITYHQDFYNCYAYDDGTAENGYGLSVASAKLAYRFTLNQPDTIGGVQMYFNQTYSTPYYKYFYITIWSSLNPETIIYKSKRKRPEFMDSINAYCNFLIDDTIVPVSGTFYVGWQQSTDDNLNVGFDRNTDSKANIFYNVDGTWQNSSYNGSLMIRPLVGTKWQQTFTGVDEPANNNFSFVVYPNPANGNYINIGLPVDYVSSEKRDKITIEIFDNLGQLVLHQPFSERIDISALNNGVYFIRLSGFDNKEAGFNKLVITR
ncbi:MAG TPA: T9SS type A sorting domain-containing protein [Bacteroidales bacterium]|nr:T9SS type A sorting domain-containing protein [Bacteroidales bacterium]